MPRRVLLIMLVVAVVLPIAITLVAGVAALLGAMGDAAGQAVLGRVALAGGIVWGIHLVCLLLVQAIHLLAGGDSATEDHES